MARVTYLFTSQAHNGKHDVCLVEENVYIGESDSTIVTKPLAVEHFIKAIWKDYPCD